MAGVKAGRIRVVVVPKLDRFSGSIFDILRYGQQLRDEDGAAFASAAERFDFTTPEGKLRFHIMAAFAGGTRKTRAARRSRAKRNAPPPPGTPATCPSVTSRTKGTRESGWLLSWGAIARA